MSYRIGIPSYKRSDRLLTLETLVSLGYQKSEIVISTQTEQDYQSYLEKFGGAATIIFKRAANDSQNRNTLIDYFDEGENFILLDDDIRAFYELEDLETLKTLRKIKSRQRLETAFDKMFEFCSRKNSPVWCWYPISNPFYMHKTVDLRNIFVGTILGITNWKNVVRFDEDFDLKGDYELSLRLIRLGYNAVRFNGYTVEAEHRSEGGCEDARREGHNAVRCAELLRRFPTLIKRQKGKDEIRFIGKRR